MRRMFASATLKLTFWYLLILLIISILFSVIIFEISTSEVSSRLERLQIRVEGSNRTLTLPGPVTLNDIRVNQTEEARVSIFFGLLYTNLAVIGFGGVGSFLLARRTLKPIEEAHEAQSRFASDASHELRTPLAVMKSEIQVAMRDQKLTISEARELMQSNLEEVDKLSNLSQSLLQLSRLDYGNLSRSDRVDMHLITQQAVKTLSDSSKRVQILSPKRPIIVDGNQTTLTDLVRILVDNALKYSPADSEVTVELKTNGRTCKVSVTNGGEGITPHELQLIFDRFYRANTPGNGTNLGGYGLGLSLAKKIVELHDGSIVATSTPGESTRFAVSLPQVRKNR